jgi:hypothetical protein
MGYKKYFFLYCFQKCTFGRCKKCTQKSVAPKPVVLVVNWQKSFSDKDKIYIFQISMKRQIFDTPFDLFKEKNVHLLESTIKNGKKPLIISKRFFINCF